MTRAVLAHTFRRTLTGLILGVMLPGAVLQAQEARQKGETPGFARMKSLIGSWRGVDPQGKPINVAYKLVSEGTAIMESLGPEGHAESMVTMYHPDHEGLMLTHYCSMGNQPRLKLDPGKSSDSTLVFTFHDVTNMASPGEAHIHGLTIIFRDKMHFAQEWVSMANGKEERETFSYEKVE